MSSNTTSTKHSLSASSGGVKKAKATASDSPSALASNKHGFAEITKRLRSVLHHRIGLPLTCLLENKSESKVKGLMLRNLSDPLEKELKSDAFDGLFRKCYSSWTVTGDPRERALTGALSTAMGGAMKDSNVIVLHQYFVSRPPGKIDVLVRRIAHDKSSSTAPVLLIEVGLQNEDWWKKVDRGITYMQALTKAVDDGDDEKEDPARFTEPMLLTVVTIEKKNQEMVSARLGVFLCTQRNPKSPSDDFRVALLWRTETEDLQELSKAFGRMLRATCLLPNWKDTACENYYEYLGPNCCRIGDKVLRAYDNRMCFTERRPDIYLAAILGLTEGTETVSEFRDASWSSLMAFGGREDDSNTSAWLWAFRGRLLIISTPFYRGRHWAKTPEEFLPIVEQLKTLHRNDYVHGDIRCCNIIFQDNKQGRLIDFDFGGKNHDDATKYPRGYQRTLFDGTRLGEGGSPVTKGDDWLSLRYVIFVFHDFVPPEHASSTTYKQRDLLKRLFAEKEAPTAEEIQELVDFLKDVGEKGWTVEPESAFRKRLEEYGYYINNSGDMKT